MRVVSILTEGRGAVCKDRVGEGPPSYWFHTDTISRISGLHHGTVWSVLLLLRECGYVEVVDGPGPANCRKRRPNARWIRVSDLDGLKKMRDVLSCLGRI